MKIKIELENGSVIEAMPLSAEIRSEVYIPADSFAGKFAFLPELQNAKSVSAYTGSSAVFIGKVDEVTARRGEKGTYIEIFARSAAASLTDNEAAPAVYNYPSTEDIYALHAAPFGIACGISENQHYHGPFTVHAGESHWQVICRFCRSVFGNEPYISAEGALCCMPAEDASPEIVISDGGRGCVCSEYEIRSRKNGEMINKIICRVQREGNYSHTLTNPFSAPGDGGVTRILDLTNTPLWERRNKTSNFFRRSMEKLTEIRALLPSEADIKTGRRAAFSSRECGTFENLYIYRRVHKINSEGAFTELTLRRKVEKIEPDN